MIQGTRVTIERNGPSQFIRITALSGYEFATNVSVTDTGDLDLEDYDHADFSIMVPGKVDDPEEVDDPPSLPKIDGLILRNRNGTKLTPDNADNSVFVPNDSIDNKDRWLYAGRYGVIGTEKPDAPFFLGILLWPTTQWFEVSVPQEAELGDEEALLMVDGVSRKRMMTWWSGKAPYMDLSTWRAALQPVIMPPGGILSIGAGGSSRLCYLSVAHSIRAFRTGEAGEQEYAVNFPLAGPSARQGRSMVASSWRGDDFKFEAKNDKYEGFDYSTSTLFTFVKPAWAFGEVFTQWHWRGDGKKCVSLQYGRTGKDEPSIPEEIVDAGFVEADVILFDGQNPDGSPILDSDLSGFSISQHNLMSMGIHPVAIDYVMHDSRKKRAYYFKHYIGPVRGSAIPVEGGPDTPVYYRDILIYLVCTIIEDDVLDGLFPGTEQWKIPVWHDTLLQGSSPASLDGYIGRPSIGEEMINAAQEAVHPYRNLRGVIAAMDPRAEAIAVKYRVMMTYPHTIAGNDLASAPHFGKYWGIWGVDGDNETHDVRQNTWINPDIPTGMAGQATGTSPPGFNPVYDWLNADPGVWEDADPPEEDPTLPPGDFFTYLEDPLALGYTLFTDAHPAYIEGVRQSLADIQGVILGMFPYFGGGAGYFAAFRSYNYFAISPTRSFSLAVEVRSNHEYVSFTHKYESNHYGVPYPWDRFDYIEKNLGRGDFDENGEEVEKGTGVFEVLTETHGDLYNSTRGTEFEWLQVPENAPTGEDLFNAAAEMAVWVE